MKMEKKKRLDFLILYFLIAYLSITWVAVLVVDILNLWGLSDWLVSKGMNNALIWVHVFTEGGPTEILQWTFLSFSVLACGFISGIHANKSVLRKAFLILGSGIALMLMEDAGNIRHILGRRISTLALMNYDGSGSNIFYIGTEFIFYAFLGFLMTYPFLRYRKELLNSLKSNKSIVYMVIGYFSYGVASIASASRNIGDWYYWLGVGIMDLFSLGERAAWHTNALGFYLIDFWFEESIELIGAGLIFTALITYALEQVLSKEL